jgi:calcium-dependent protein kinase
MDPDERWDADTALKSKWIKSISELLIADITESKSEDKCKEIAISSLRALRNFKRPNDAKKMKTAAHAIIANLLLKED